MPDIEGVPYEASGGKVDRATAEALAARHREAASAGAGAASGAVEDAKRYADSIAWQRGALEDRGLDSVVEPGTYWQSTASRATTGRGYPRDGMLCVLEVQRAATSIVTQTLTHYDSTGVQGVYRRTVYTNGRVTEWVQVAGGDDAPVATRLRGESLDTLTTPGDYYQPATADATLARGYPRAGMTLTLRVEQAASSIVVQSAKQFDSGGYVGTWTRTVGSSGPTPWRPGMENQVALLDSDLNSVTVQGTYFQSTASNATVARGYPRDGMTGVLTVDKAAGSVVLQTYTHYDSTGVQGVYHRTVYQNGRVTGWVQVSGGPGPSNPGPTPAPPQSTVIPAAATKVSPRRGSIMIRFDDGLSGLSHAAEYMAQFGLSAYLAAIPNRTSRDEIKALHTKYGWEIGNHTADHLTVKDAGFLKGVDEGSRLIQSLTGEYPFTFTYPTGARTAETDREMAMRFNQIQLTSEPNTSAVNAFEPSMFSGWTVIDGLSSPEVKARTIDKFKRYVLGSTGQGLIPTLAFHEVGKPDQEVTSGGMVPWAWFVEIIDWLASVGIETTLPRMVRQAQIVVDPGFNAYPVHSFSDGYYPWATSTYQVWNRVTEGQYSGLGCMRVSSTSAVTGSVSQGLALEPGRQYRMHALIDSRLTAGSVSVTLRPRLMDGRYVGDTLELVKPPANSGGWKDYTATFTMPSGTQNASLFILATGATGTALVDHVSIMRADLHDPLDPTKP